MRSGTKDWSWRAVPIPEPKPKFPRRARWEDIKAGAVVKHNNVEWRGRDEDQKIVANKVTLITTPDGLLFDEDEIKFWTLVRPAPEPMPEKLSDLFKMVLKDAKNAK